MSSNPIVINGHFRNQQVTGVQRYALEIIKELDNMGTDYTLVEPPATITSDSLRQLWMQTMMHKKIPESSLLWSPTNIGPVFYKKQVVTLHDIADQLHPEWFSSKYVNWRRIILPRLLRNVKGIITVSEHSRQTILNEFPAAEGKIEVIYNGVRTAHFYVRPATEIAEVKQKFSLEKPYIITVGSLDPRKNINGLIKAWNILPPHIKKELDLVIVGGSADMFTFQLEEKIDSSVRFIGYVEYDSLPALYSGALFFVYPSLFEGFGLPVLEAMACRIPVITSSTTSLGELAGEKALKVNPDNPEEISEAIQKFYRSEQVRNEYGAKGYRHAQSFTWKKSAEQTLQFLKSVENDK